MRRNGDIGSRVWFEVDSIDDDALVARIESDRARPFDDSVAPLLRASLYRAGPGACVMLVVFDHLVGDGWSLWQLNRRAAAGTVDGNDSLKIAK